MKNFQRMISQKSCQEVNWMKRNCLGNYCELQGLLPKNRKKNWKLPARNRYGGEKGGEINLLHGLCLKLNSEDPFTIFLN